jgi:hypothetical protein
LQEAKERLVEPGDLVRVVRLPKYWGAADIRGSVGIVLSMIPESSFCIVLIDGKEWKAIVSGLEVLRPD